MPDSNPVGAERVDRIPSHTSPPADGIVYCTINRQHFRVPCGHYTGAAIRSWHEPPISGDRDLWLVTPGGPDEQYGEVDEYLFDRSGTRWFDTPRFINGGAHNSIGAEPLSDEEWLDEWRHGSVAEYETYARLIRMIDDLRTQLVESERQRKTENMLRVQDATARMDAEAETARLRGHIVAAIREIGIAGDGYPAPVANAHDILRAALGAQKEGA